VSDITAYILLCECQDHDDCWDILPRFWVPEAALEDPKNRNRDLYQQWHKRGLLETTPGNSTDYDFIEAAILKDAQAFHLVGIGIDRLFQGQQVANHLTDEGVDVAPIGQSAFAQGAPMKEFERRHLAKQLHHGGHEILRWMADNVEVKQDQDGNLKIVKPNSKNDPRKVDGMTALVNALSWVARDVYDGESAYADGHGLMVV
jgi:phage terminase large subunit-like protein